jgi:Putative zinc- or iron-chelating domain
MKFSRITTHRYEDPLDRVWLVAAERLGFRIERSPDVYASTDGQRTIIVGTDDTLDADDCLAQMILHELCHAAVEGEDAEHKVDWGLDNETERDVAREHACLRLQAYLTGLYGLRGLLAPTTDYRAFWDALADDPFAASDGRRDASAVAARAAAYRMGKSPWAPHVHEALAASAAIARAVPLVGGPGAMPSLWSKVEPAPTPHPLAHAPVAAGGNHCGECAWSFRARGAARCWHVESARLDPAWPACVRFEPAAELDCLTCGACCREAYHSVEISRREPVIKRHPELVVVHDNYLELKREGERCAALEGGRTPQEGYACRIYEDRPRTCREFTRGSKNCLDARRRVGLSL